MEFTVKMTFFGRLRRVEARLARLQEEMMTQAEFQPVLAELKQSIADLGTRVAAKISDLEAQIAANVPVDLTAEAASINEDITSLAAIVPAPAPVAEPPAEPAPAG